MVEQGKDFVRCSREEADSRTSKDAARSSGQPKGSSRKEHDRTEDPNGVCLGEWRYVARWHRQAEIEMCLAKWRFQDDIETWCGCHKRQQGSQCKNAIDGVPDNDAGGKLSFCAFVLFAEVGSSAVRVLAGFRQRVRIALTPGLKMKRVLQ